MKKITKVILHNYKSHSHSEIPLDNFTAIIGPTNSGKSATVSGIKLCLYNEPSGKRFITHGEKLCYVEVHFNDDTSIRRTRGEDDNGEEVNLYELKDSDGRVTPLTNFGVGPVEPVVSFHGMPKVNLFGDSESLNICNQFDSPFFLSESPQKRAKMIGKLAKTDVADLALQNTNTEIRRKKASKKEYSAELKEVEESLSDLKDLPQMELTLEDLKEKMKKAEEKSNILSKIELIKKEMAELIGKRDFLFDLIQYESGIDKFIDKMDKLISLNLRLNKAISVSSNLVTAIGERDKAKDIIESTDMDKIEVVTKSMDNLVVMMANIINILKIHNKLKVDIEAKELSENIINNVQGVDDVIENIDKCRSMIQKMNNLSSIGLKMNYEIDRTKKGKPIISQLEKEYEVKFQEYKNALINNKQCPICMSELDEKRVEGIKDLI